MANDIVVTDEQFTDGLGTFPLESQEWYQWLELTHKFRYEDAAGKMTCYKQERSGSFCWYGQKRRDGILRTQYLGKSEDLTAKVLHTSCKTLNLPKQDWLNRKRKRPTQTKTQQANLSPTEKMLYEREREQRIELEQKLDSLTEQYQESLKKCETVKDNHDKPESYIECETIDAAIEILSNALTLKANAGGKIKDEIRKAIALLKSDN